MHDTWKKQTTKQLDQLSSMANQRWKWKLWVILWVFLLQGIHISAAKGGRRPGSGRPKGGMNYGGSSRQTYGQTYVADWVRTFALGNREAMRESTPLDPNRGGASLQPPIAGVYGSSPSHRFGNSVSNASAAPRQDNHSLLFGFSYFAIIFFVSRVQMFA
jgi:hypothetical protein